MIGPPRSEALNNKVLLALWCTCVLTQGALAQNEPADYSAPAVLSPTGLITADETEAADTNSGPMAVFGRAGLPDVIITPGEEFDVGSTAGDQCRPSIAADAAGNFVVVWDSTLPGSGPDTDGLSIQSQRFDSKGTLGIQFQVNTYTTGDQKDSVVARQPGGAFVVAWQSYGSSGTDIDGFSIQAQRFAATGVLMGSEFQVNTYTTSDQTNPSVSFEGDGSSFIVVWESMGSSGSDSDGFSIQGQRYTADGSTTGSQFQVNADTTGMQTKARVIAATDGTFMVVWESDSASITDDFGIRGQVFNSDGSLAGGEFALSTATTELQRNPVLKLTPGDGFVVVWENELMAPPSEHLPHGNPRFRIRGTTGPALDGDDVSTGRFDITEETALPQVYPTVTVNQDGGFVVASVDQPMNSIRNIRGKTFRPTPTAPVASSSQFSVGDPSINIKELPSATFKGNEFVVVWQQQEMFGTAVGPDKDLKGQRFLATDLDTLFDDGFESGDTGAWTSSVPRIGGGDG